MKHVFVGLALALAATFSTAAQESTAPNLPVRSAEQAAQAQLDAYNAHDIRAFVLAYSENVQVYNFPNEISIEGRAELRRRYAPYFSNTPDLQVKMIKRIVNGQYVVDEQEGVANGNKFTATAIYHVSKETGKIDKVWFIQ